MVERFVSIEEAAGSMPAFSTFKFFFVIILSSSFCLLHMLDIFNGNAAHNNSTPKHVRESMRDLWSAAFQPTKLTKRQVAVNIVTHIDLLAEILDHSNDSDATEFEQVLCRSTTIYSTIIKGLCVIFSRQLDVLMRDCEHSLLFKTLVQVPTAARVTTGSVKRRISLISGGPPVSLASRRSTVSSLPAPVEDLDSIMNLDALFEELSRPAAVARRSRSSSSVSEDAVGRRSRSGCSEDQDAARPAQAFEAITGTPAVNDLDHLLDPLPPLTPPEEGAKKPTVQELTPPTAVPPRRREMRGFDAKITFTSTQWSKLLKGDHITTDRNITPQSVVEAGVPTILQLKAMIRLQPHAAARKEKAAKHDDAVSAAEAVDLDTRSVLDELRGDDDVDFYDHSRPMTRRLSVASRSSMATNSRRQSLVSDIFELPEDHRRLSSLGNPAEDLKRAILDELDSRHVNRKTVIGFRDIAPVTSTDRRLAASTFAQLLVLSSKREIKFIAPGHKVGFNDGLSFTVAGSSSSSASSE